MRTTLSIDSDVLFAVKERARREGRSIGAVLSDLVREALTRREEIPEAGDLYGFDPLPHRGGVVSNDLVDDLRENEPE